METGTLELEQQDVDTSDVPEMIHLQDLDRGFPWALCGKRCREEVSHDTPVDCVVCEAMFESRYGRFFG